MNHILLHYHIFKNAGTSLDGILERIFGDDFYLYDKKNPGATIAPREINGLIKRYSNIRAFSSHQIKFPRPNVQGAVVHQVLFLRHPLARVESCFQFEKNIQKIYPRETTLEEYVRKHLDSERLGAVIGIQTRVLADNPLFSDGDFKKTLTNTVVESAIRNLDNCDAFGVVEKYAKSLEIFEKCFRLYFSDFYILDEEKRKKLNASKNPFGNLEQSIDSLKGQLNVDTYAQLKEELWSDLLIYHKGLDLFDRRCNNLDR